jgi:hypothetical protein
MWGIYREQQSRAEQDTIPATNTAVRPSVISIGLESIVVLYIIIYRTNRTCMRQKRVALPHDNNKLLLLLLPLHYHTLSDVWLGWGVVGWLGWWGRLRGRSAVVSSLACAEARERMRSSSGSQSPHIVVGD